MSNSITFHVIDLVFIYLSIYWINFKITIVSVPVSISVSLFSWLFTFKSLRLMQMQWHCSRLVSASLFFPTFSWSSPIRILSFLCIHIHFIENVGSQFLFTSSVSQFQQFTNLCSCSSLFVMQKPSSLHLSNLSIAHTLSSFSLSFLYLNPPSRFP